MTKTIFTEEEAINITIKHGYNGAEFETKAWLQRGCLKPDRTLEALKSKLETIYSSVSIDGKGKKRKYVLTDKKDKVSEREYNYTGYVVPKQDEIMKEYIFNKLLSYDGYNQSYKGWARIIGFINTDTLNIQEMITRLKSLHLGFPMKYNPKEAVSIFIHTLNVRNKDVIEKSFQRLQKENRINVHELYNIKTLTGKYRRIDQLQYELILEHIKDFLEELNITYYNYSQSLNSVHKTKEMKIAIQKVQDMLEEEYKIKYIFKTFNVTILDSTVKQEILKEEFEKSYFERLIKLTIDRQSKDKYNTSLSFWKRFYLLNTLELLKYLNIEEASEHFMKEYSLKSRKTSKFDNDHFQRIVDETDLRKNTFGNI